MKRSVESSCTPPRALSFAFASLFAVALGGATCGGTGGRKSSDGVDGSPPAEAAKQPERAEFVVFAFGRVLGTIAPCGCTTEPLGGLQYAFGRLDAASDPNARLVLEPGSFLYPEIDGVEWPTDKGGWDQAEDRAALLTKAFLTLGDKLVSGVGPTDLASPSAGKALQAHALPRVVTNVKSVPGGPEFVDVRVVELESHGIRWKVGVTTVIDPEVQHHDRLKGLGTLEPPAAALDEAVEAMKAQGAEFTVVLAQGSRKFAESLASEVEGLDVVVVGHVEALERARLGTPAAKVGDTWVVEPGEQLQTVTELRVSIDPSTGKVPDPSTWSFAPPRTDLEQELARVRERIASFERDPEADKAFIARLQDERARLEQDLQAVPTGPAVAVFENVKITCKLPVDDSAAAALQQYVSHVSASNKARFEGVKAPAPKRGQAGYAGIEACADCHEEAVEFWKTTVHANAYETLEVDNKQYDLSCVSCHVTGFRQPGGSEVVENEGLVDVQCEVCHGPGSLHVADGGDDLSRITRDTTAQLCATGCHTPEHSDTFDYVPYLRDVLGPGHGEDRRKALGDGPTGAELRKAGLAKAGGPCKKTM